MPVSFHSQQQPATTNSRKVTLLERLNPLNWFGQGKQNLAARDRERAIITNQAKGLIGNKNELYEETVHLNDEGDAGHIVYYDKDNPQIYNIDPFIYGDQSQEIKEFFEKKASDLPAESKAVCKVDSKKVTLVQEKPDTKSLPPAVAAEHVHNEKIAQFDQELNNFYTNEVQGEKRRKAAEIILSMPAFIRESITNWLKNKGAGQVTTNDVKKLQRMYKALGVLSFTMAAAVVGLIIYGIIEETKSSGDGESAQGDMKKRT